MAEEAQKGYGYGKQPLWKWVLIYVVVGGILYALIYFFVLKKNGGYNYYGNSPQQNTNVLPSTPPANTGTNIITTKTDKTKGAYLADFNGMTLYTYDRDTKGTSNCYKGCAVAWPPYSSGATAQKTFPENISVITRTDGSKQFAWKNMPLYYYQTDQNVGDITGDGVGGVWHLVKP